MITTQKLIGLMNDCESILCDEFLPQCGQLFNIDFHRLNNTLNRITKVKQELTNTESIATITMSQLAIAEPMQTKFGKDSKTALKVRTIYNGEVGQMLIHHFTSIAFKPVDGSSITLDSGNYDYSQSTGFYRNQFLHETLADTRKKIKSGEYILGNLNG